MQTTSENTELAPAFTPGRLGDLTLKNRVLKAATFEGMTPDGVPTPKLAAFHSRLAEGGVAMTTLAYCAAEADGRMHPRMLYLHEGIETELAELVAQVQAAGARVSGQLVHCGSFSKNRELRRSRRPLGPSRQLNQLGLAAGMPFSGAMSRADIDHLVGAFADAAGRMKRVGFDAIELHFGHGYALSQFISPLTNRRSDEYGGSLANRMRLPLRVLEAVRGAVGEGFPLLGKISMSDGARGGVHWDEGVEVARHLDRGGIDALVTSAGTSSMNPMLMFRGDSILPGMLEQEKNPLMRLGLRLAGQRFFRDYPYEELFLMEPARRIREAVRCALVYIGGCSTRESLDAVMREGFDFVQLGRVLLKDPDFVRNAAESERYRSGCTHCNRCVPLIDDPAGIRCPLNDT